MSSYAELNAARFCGSILDGYMEVVLDAATPVFFRQQAVNSLESLFPVFEAGVRTGYFDEKIAGEWYARFLSSDAGQSLSELATRAPLKLEHDSEAVLPVDSETALMLIETVYSSGELFTLSAMLNCEDRKLWQLWSASGTWALRSWLSRSSENIVTDPLADCLLNGIFLQESMRTLVGDAILGNRFDEFCAVIDYVVRESAHFKSEYDVIGNALIERLRHNGIETRAVESSVAVVLWRNSWDAVRIGEPTSYKPHDDGNMMSPEQSRHAQAVWAWAIRTLADDRPELLNVVGEFMWRAVQSTVHLLDAGAQDRRAFLARLGESVLLQKDQVGVLQTAESVVVEAPSRLEQIRRSLESESRRPQPT